MKKTLISIAVASAMVSGAAMASGHGSPSFIYKNMTVGIDYVGPTKSITHDQGQTLDVNVDLGVDYSKARYYEDSHLVQATSGGAGSTLSGASSTSEAHGGIIPTRSRPAPVDPYAENFSASKSTVISGGESSAAEWDNSFDASGRGSEFSYSNRTGDTASLDIGVEASRDTFYLTKRHHCSSCTIGITKTEVNGSLEADKAAWNNTDKSGSRYSYRTHADEKGAATYSKGGTIQGSETLSSGFAVDEGTNQGWAKSDGSAIGATDGVGTATGTVLDRKIKSGLTTFTLGFHGDLAYQQWNNYQLDKTGMTLSGDYDKTFIMAKKSRRGN